jgi:glycosyltransferase involved in cell wall biosynthesis
MKILHLLSQKPEGTGSGVTVQALMREAARRGHETYLLAGLESHEEVPRVVSGDFCSFVEFSSSSLPFRVVGMSDVMPYPSTRFCDLSGDDISLYESCFREKILDVVTRLKPDIIHSHHLWILTSLARKMIGDIPIVATCHGSDIRQYHLCPSLRDSVRAGCSALASVLVLSEAQKKEVRELYGIPEERLAITGIGYDEGLFTGGGQRTAGEACILYAGKLSRAKGVLWLMHALASIDRPPWHLHIAGGGAGSEADEVREEARGLASRVTLHGAMPQQHLAELMRKAHIFVLPSFYEGFPLVLVEALACGCRLVATELPGVKEIFSQAHLGDALTMVPMPALEGPDVPRESELPTFVERLKSALLPQISGALGGRLLRQDAVNEFLGNYTWERVFDRVQRAYEKVSEPS